MSLEEEAVSRLVRRLEALGIPYMVAGSVASSHHGLPRATNDADIVIDPTPEALDTLVAALLAEGYYVDARVAREALRSRRLFNVIDPETAFKVDLIADALGVLRVCDERIDRAYIERWAAPLEVEDLWRELLDQLSR